MIIVAHNANGLAMPWRTNRILSVTIRVKRTIKFNINNKPTVAPNRGYQQLKLMKNLIKEIEDYQNSEMPDDLLDKLEGETMPGAHVEIFWKDREETDTGYVFVLPNQSWDEADVCVHVPKPDNSDGIGDAPEVHIHISNLLINERVEKVVVTGGYD